MVEITAILLYHNDMKKKQEGAAKWQALLAKKDDEIASLNRQVEWLTQQLRLMQGQRFGASSERTQVLSEQFSLFNETEALIPRRRSPIWSKLHINGGSKRESGSRTFPAFPRNR